MLTYEDCIALCELDEDEVEAIAEHEHIPRIAAAELGNYLVHSHEGVVGISTMIRDDLEHARAHGDVAHAAKLKLVLKHFIDHHAEDFGGRTS
jgi:hypothetical protein